VRWFDAGTPRGRTLVVHDRVWTLANAITAVRLLGLPVFVWLVLGAAEYGWAFLVLVLLGATDWVDGYVARRFDQVTRLGRLMDPLIDRMLLATAAVTLVVAGFLPLLLALLVLVRDVALLLGVAIRYRGIPPVPVSRAGKFATACLLVGVPAFLPANLDWPGAGALAVVAWVATLVGIAAYYVAGVQYVRDAAALPR